MAPKNYRTHFPKDVRLVATKIREIATRVDDIANRMDASTHGSINFVDRKKLDAALLNIAEWAGKAVLALDTLDVESMSTDAGIATAAKRTTNLLAVCEAAEKRLLQPLSSQSDSTADVETARELSKAKKRTPAKRSS